MIIGRDLMVQLGLMTVFKRQFLHWYDATAHIKEPSGLLGKFDITKRKRHEVVIQTSEPSSTQEANEIMVKFLDITYAKIDLNQVAENSTQLNAEERTLLLSLLEDCEDLFDGTLGYCTSEPVD